MVELEAEDVVLSSVVSVQTAKSYMPSIIPRICPPVGTTISDGRHTVSVVERSPVPINSLLATVHPILLPFLWALTHRRTLLSDLPPARLFFAAYCRQARAACWLRRAQSGRSSCLIFGISKGASRVGCNVCPETQDRRSRVVAIAKDVWTLSY